MDVNFKKIFIVSAGSICVAVGITIILMSISYPLGITDHVANALFGEWRLELRLAISAIAFPFLWHYMKVDTK